MRLASALIVCFLTLTVLSCGPNTERALLGRFFAASRLRDLTALANFATVVFEPATDGVITDFDIVGITAVPRADGVPMSEDVSISAPVRLPDGRTVVKTFAVTLQRVMPGDQDPRHGWRITAIRVVDPASP
jgi:hypothetical protein